MKKNLLISFALCLITFTGLAQSGCSKFYPFDEGTTFQITNYSKKGKSLGTIDYVITNSRTIDGAEVVTVTSQIKDEKGKLIVDSAYDVTCKDDLVSIDFKSMVSSKILDQYNDFETEITGTNLDLPNNLAVGQELPDSSLLMTINMGITMNMSIYITDRVVIAKEALTTPAGTFDCFVISYKTDLKMGIKRTGTSKLWITEGVGMVKQEEYNKKGKLMSSSELTAFNK